MLTHSYHIAITINPSVHHSFKNQSTYMLSFRLVILSSAILIVFSMILQTVAVQNRLGAALEMMEQVNDDLSAARDSLQSTQQTMDMMLKKVVQAQTDLEIIRSQVEVIDLKYQHDKEANSQKLRQLKEELLTKEQRLISLKQEALKFDY